MTPINDDDLQVMVKAYLTEALTGWEPKDEPESLFSFSTRRRAEVDCRVMLTALVQLTNYHCRVDNSPETLQKLGRYMDMSWVGKAFWYSRRDYSVEVWDVGSPQLAEALAEVAYEGFGFASAINMGGILRIA